MRAARTYHVLEGLAISLTAQTHHVKVFIVLGDCGVVADGTNMVFSAGGSCVFERSKGSKCGGGRYDVTLNDKRKNAPIDFIS